MALLLVLLALTACYREVTDVPSHPRHDDRVPLAVDGVRPGMTVAEVKAVPGEPRGSSGPPDPLLLRWPPPKESTVAFDRAGRASDITGSALTAGDRTVVWQGAAEAEVIQILGKPDRTEKSYRSKGAFVISTGRELVGKTLIYRRNGIAFSISVVDDSVRLIRATPDSP